MHSRSGEEPVRIASRGSQLALWQAEWVRGVIGDAGGRGAEVQIVRTTGDRIQDVPLARIGDRGLFTKEIDEALLEGRADVAVHSLKDVPTRIPAGLRIVAITEREDPRDVFIAAAGAPTRLGEMPAGARIGTSSLRRRAQLKRMRPDLEVVDLRGNLNTRMAKLDAGDYDGILLAAAGVVRLGWADRVSERLDTRDWLPAVGQGALGVIIREDDDATAALVVAVHHPRAAAEVLAERAFLRELEGGCQVPIAALARHDGDALVLDGLVAGLDGEPLIRESTRGPASDPESVGRTLASRLIGLGASEILEEVRRTATAPGIPAP